ncbi:MCE family protein [Mycolicibacterium thermoresistibile]
MHLNRRIRLQLAVFSVIAMIAGAVMTVNFMKLPTLLFGVGRYSVTLELPQAAGLYVGGNVTYRGTTVGEVEQLRLAGEGIEAVLSLKKGIDIPSNLDAGVHSVSAAGEQFVALTPRDATSTPLVSGDVITRDRTSVPPDISALLDATDRGLQAIPPGNVKTVIDESYTAFGGLGPELSRMVRAATQLAVDARHNLEPLLTLIEKAQPVLEAHGDTADEIDRWAAQLASITEQLQTQDHAVVGILRDGPEALDQSRHLFERLTTAVPILLANLVSIGKVAVAYQPALEQLLVLLPQGVASLQGSVVANLNTEQDYSGAFLDFNLNVNLPPPCTTGFLPVQQQRNPALTDYPDVPDGDVYCRIPQDAHFNVRGARNLPCLTVPGKRAPTVKMCESDEEYVPLNDGLNWKGDPNATLSGQDIPQVRPTVPAPAPVAIAEYDPATGSFTAPDGQTYTRSDLTAGAGERTWQSMLLPPGS